jgi:tetratricopeptide (TPR) repeat protein
VIQSDPYEFFYRLLSDFRLESRPRTRYARSRRASTKLEQLGKTETPTMIMRLSQSMPSLQTSKPLEHLRPQIDPALAACLQGAEDLEEMYHEKSNNTFFITEVDAKAAIEQQSIARRLAQGAFQLYGIGDFTSAINQLSSLLSTAEKKQDFAMMALCAHHIGMALKEDSQRIKWAIMMQKKCLEHAERVKDSLLEARAHKALGVAYYEIKDYRLALEHQEKALKIAQGGSDPELEGRIYANIGNLSSAQDNWEEALDAHKKDLAIAVRIDCIVGQARAHKNLSIVYNHLDQSSKQVGVDHANIAQSLSSDAFFRDVESHPNDSVGNIYTQITRHDYQIAELVANSLRDIIDQYKRERS